MKVVTVLGLLLCVVLGGIAALYLMDLEPSFSSVAYIGGLFAAMPSIWMVALGCIAVGVVIAAGLYAWKANE